MNDKAYYAWLQQQQQQYNEHEFNKHWWIMYMWILCICIMPETCAPNRNQSKHNLIAKEMKATTQTVVSFVR